MIAAVALFIAAGGHTLQKVEYLSDEPDRLVHIEQGWGLLGFDVCAHSAEQTPLPLQIGSKTYAKGLGNHAPGKLVVDLDRRYATFDAVVGVNKQPAPVGSVIFSAYVDGVKRFESGVMTQESPAKPVHFAVSGADTLTLVAEPASGDISCDCADWADARLIVAPNAKPNVREDFDVADCAQVCTWDPARMDGARASRIEEYHSADIYLDRPVRPTTVYSLPNRVTRGMGMNGEGYRLPESGCIGLVWLEPRRPTKLTVEFRGGLPNVAGARVEAWVGPYPFQGTWKPLAGSFGEEGDRLTFAIDPKANPDFVGGFRKVRWVLPMRGDATGRNSKSPEPPAPSPLLLRRTSHRGKRDEGVVVTQLTATIPARMKLAKLRIEAVPRMGGSVSVAPFGCEIEGGAFSWHTAEAKTFTVRYPAGAGFADGPGQPALRFGPPGQDPNISTPRSLATPSAFSVRLGDVLAGRGVYLADQGLFISKAGQTLRAYRKSIAGEKTVLERVRSMPDQTFGAAMAKTYRPVHFGGPTLLSLGSDNWKWLVEADGSVVWEPKAEVADKQMPFENRRCAAVIRFNGRPLHPVADPVLPAGMERWMPVVSLEAEPSQAKGSQRTQCRFTAFVAPVGGRGLFVGRIDLDGSGTLDLSFLADCNRGVAAKVVSVARRIEVIDGDRLVASVEMDGGTSRIGGTGGTLEVSGEGSVTFTIPGWDAARQVAQDEARTSPRTPYEGDFIRYWKAVGQTGMQIQIPDKLLSDIIETSRIRCIVDARNEDDEKRIAPWIAEIHYGPLESEANTLIRGMALMGHRDYVERSLDYFIHLYNPAGYLTTGYTVVGTGWHLWTLGEAFALNPDRAWLKRHAADVARVCRWVITQRRKTMKLDVLGQKPPQYGLVPPGVIADWNAYQYYFYSNGTYCAGLEAAGKALESIGYPGAAAFVKEAAAYRQDIVRAYRWAQARTPAVELQDGTWVPGQPSQIHCPGPLSEYYPGDDGSRSWCYDVEVGPHNLIQQGILSPDGTDSKEMADHLEDDMFLREGWGDYPAAETRKDWFDLGGFAKVQPYYARLAEVYAMRDDVKPFIRSYFNAIAAMVDPANLTLWEHFDHMGAPDKTHETGVFLQQTRFMFVKERDRELWLAPMVTNNWMKDGMVVSIQQAPTFFGEAGYRIESHIAKGHIDAVVTPPTRTLPSEIVLRLRHPDGKRMKSVTVNGKPWPRFDPAREIVMLPADRGELRVRAWF